MSDDVDVLTITIPAVPHFARLARLTVAGIASRAGFGYDDVEDVRIATGEVFSLLVAGPQPDEQVRIECALGADRMDVTATRTGAAADGGPSHLTSMILDATTLNPLVSADGRTVAFSKSLTAAGGA